MWWAIAIGIVAFGVCAHAAGTPSLWFDEAYSVGLATQPLQVMFHYLWGIECQMTLYYMLLHLWLGFQATLGAEQSEFILRLPSLIATALAAMALYRIGARWWGRVAGVVAAFVFLTNPVVLRQAQETRSYALQVLLLILAWYAFLAALEAADTSDVQLRWRWWAAFAAMLTLAVYAQIDTFVCAVAFPIALAALAIAPGSPTGESGRWRTRARASIRPFLFSAIATGIAVVPIGVDMALHGGGNGWVPSATMNLLVQMVQVSFLAGMGWILWPLLAVVLLALIPEISRGWMTALLRPFSPLTLTALSWFLALLALFTFLPIHLFHWRYMVVIVPPFALLVGIGAARLQMPVAKAVGVLLLIGIVALLPGAYYRTTRDDYRTTAEWLNARLQPGDGAVCWPDLYCSVPMSYYVPELLPQNSTYPGVWIWADHSSIQQLSIALHPTLSGGPAFSSYLATHQRIWLIMAPHGTPVNQALQDEHDEEQQMVAAGFHVAPTAGMFTDAVVALLYVRGP